MKKTYKIIPFNLETAKKIQAGEVEGRIVCNEREFHRILCFDAIGLHPVVALLYDGVDEVAFSFSKNGYFRSSTAIRLFIELPEEAPEEQHPIEESELYQAGYKVGFEAGRCAAFDEKKGCAIKKEAPKYDDVEEVPTGDESIVFLRHKKHEFKPFDKVLVRNGDNKWKPAFYGYRIDNRYSYITTGDFKYEQCIPYEGNEHLVGTTDKPKEE